MKRLGAGGWIHKKNHWVSVTQLITRLIMLILWSYNKKLWKNYLACTSDIDVLKLQMEHKHEQSSTDICRGCSFILTLIREKESMTTKWSSICNNSSVAWLKTHLCCATEFYVLIGLLSDNWAQLIVSIRACRTKYQLSQSSCRHLWARLLSGLHLMYI